VARPFTLAHSVASDAMATLDATACPMRPPVVFQVPWGDARARMERRALTASPELWIATTGPQEWAGFVVSTSEDGEDWSPEEGAWGRRALCGELLDPLPLASRLPSPVRIALYDRGAIAAVTDDAAERGQSLCYVGDGRNGYELFAYSWAELLERRPDGAHVYALAGKVCRGLYGTVVTPHAAGTRFVALGRGVYRLSLPDRLIGWPFWVRVAACNGSGEGEEDLGGDDIDEGDADEPIRLELGAQWFRGGA
jgi:hypothetical protein